jgi:hypothetical protein
MIVGGSNGNDGKMFTQWDLTFAAQMQLVMVATA